MKEKSLQRIKTLVLILLILLILYCLLLLKPFWQPVLRAVFFGLLPFLGGGFIAFLLQPLVARLENAGMKRVFAIILIYLIFFGGGGYGLYVGFPVIIEQVGELSERVPALAEQYRSWLRQIDDKTEKLPPAIREQVGQRISDFEGWLEQFLEKIISVLVEGVNFLIVLAVIPFVAFYFLNDIGQVKKAAWYVTPKKWRESGTAFVGAVNLSLGKYVRGQLLVCLLIGAAAAVSFWLLGLDYPILLGIIVGITNVIPYFGPFIGAVPVVLIAVMSSVKLAIFAIGIIFVLQFLESNFLSPHIIGKSINVHPLFIIGALILGGEVGGIAGLVLAIPFLVIIKIAIVHARDHFIRLNRTS